MGAIHGTCTSNQIFTLKTDIQQLFYAGIIESTTPFIFKLLKTRMAISFLYLSGFPEYLNDGKHDDTLRKGGDQLPFPDQCILLADKIPAHGTIHGSTNGKTARRVRTAKMSQT